VTEKLPILLREGDSADFAHVVTTWIASYASSDFGRTMKHSTYIQNHKPIAQDCVEQGQIMIACNNQDLDYIYGYTVYERLKDLSIIHYVHVKPAFRRFGIATMLLNSVTMNKFVATHRTRDAKKLPRKDYDFNPYIFLRRKLK
jgi:GNAT superfamily N-acetyltransferase